VRYSIPVPPENFGVSSMGSLVQNLKTLGKK
jgi:hypothetical protein